MTPLICLRQYKLIAGLLLEIGPLKFFTVSVLMTASAFMEMVGFSSIAPVIALSIDYENAIQNEYISSIHSYFGQPDKTSFIVYAAFASMLLLCFMAVIMTTSMWLKLTYIKIVNHRLSGTVFKALLTESIEVFEIAPLSVFQQRVNYICTRISSGAVDALLILCSRSAQIAIISIALLAFYPILGLVGVVVVSFLYALIYILIKRKIVEQTSGLHDAELAIKKIINSSYLSYRELHIDGRMDATVSMFRLLKEEALIKAKRIELFNSLPRIIIETIGLSAVVIIVSILAFRSGSDENILLTIGVALAGYRLLPSAHQIYHSINRYVGVISLMREIEPVVDKRPPIQAGRDNNQLSLNLDYESPSVVLDQVTYAIGDEKNVFTDLSLTFPFESVVKISGDSGSGKSILMELIIGLRVPAKGRIIVFGCDINNVPKKEYWKKISYVGQEFYLSGEHKYDIVTGGIIDHERLEVVSKVCQLEKLGKDYVGYNGSELSGGQRARLALARAFYKKSDLVFIDETLSSLDIESARHITREMVNKFPKRRFIIISHRIGEVEYDAGEILLCDASGMFTK